MNKIRGFVNNGGRYIGFCSGAFFALVRAHFMVNCGAVSEMAYVDNVKLTATPPGITPGTYEYTVYAKDTSGNHATPIVGSFTIQ